MVIKKIGPIGPIGTDWTDWTDWTDCPHVQTRILAERGGRSTANSPERRPRFSPLQKSVTLLVRGKRNEIFCGALSQLNKQKTVRPGKLIVPTRNESSAKRAATPVGGCS